MAGMQTAVWLNSIVAQYEAVQRGAQYHSLLAIVRACGVQHLTYRKSIV